MSSKSERIDKIESRLDALEGSKRHKFVAGDKVDIYVPFSNVSEKSDYTGTGVVLSAHPENSNYVVQESGGAMTYHEEWLTLAAEKVTPVFKVGDTVRQMNTGVVYKVWWVSDSLATIKVQKDGHVYPYHLHSSAYELVAEESMWQDKLASKLQIGDIVMSSCLEKSVTGVEKMPFRTYIRVTMNYSDVESFRGGSVIKVKRV